VALARVERLSFAYPGGHSALEDVSLEIEPGELVVLLGPSGSGKSTLLRALAGLVPHFHGGRFSGSVTVAGLDSRKSRPADLAGTVATLFQDPEDQVVMTRVENEVAFGLENLGTRPAEIPGRARAALASVGASHLAGRAVAELSGGELQRVCLAATLALEPGLLLLDEPTSQLDPDAARSLLDLARSSGLDRGRIVLDAPRARALDWLACEHPAWSPGRTTPCNRLLQSRGSPTERVVEPVCRLERVSFSYQTGMAVLDGVDLELRRGEVVALVGANGSGKTTLAKLATGLLELQGGTVVRYGRAGYLPQDPGRYLVAERADEEVALAVGGDLERARRALAAVGLAGFETRHPRDLSSGERERLALAAVAVADPDLLVLDEPTRGVDPERKAELAHALRRAAPSRATLVVTHDLAFAAAVADRVVSLDAKPEALVA